VGKVLGSWLSGPASVTGQGTEGAAKGVRLGLPESGPGSVATMARRAAAFAADAIGSALVAAAFTAPHPPNNWSLLVFAVEYLFFTALFGQTPGMRLLKIRLYRLDRPGHAPGPFRALLRTFLLMLLIPAVIYDRDNRGYHDRLTDIVVVEA
jgi:uncharacterized RDD family membrane protein YckC